MKHIAFVINNIYGKGGTERVTSQLANLLINYYDITIISLKSGQNINFYVDERIDIIELRGISENKLVRRLFNLIELNKHITNKNIDMFINVDITLSLYTLPFRKRVKNISWEHFNFFSESNSRIRQFSRKISSRYSDAVVVLSDADLKNYQSNLKRYSNIRRIYNPIAFNKEVGGYNLNSKVVLSVGRLESQKGFDILLDAWKNVSNDGSWVLKIIGDGSKKEELLAKISQNHINNVMISPFTNDIEKEYINSAIYVMSSRYEGFGLALAEAQSKGLPLITFDCPEGPAEIVGYGDYGILIENGNVQSLSNELSSLMNSIELREYWSNASLKGANRFNTQEILNEWINLFEEIWEQ
ncbi:N-acetylgalactosamine-N,N'-diacetylbacillosaminyl-diphospho-undecaprenol 4-alpha-N-acetylgalactosaminyltransferase [Streptococcus infantarius subsp. infantarius]|nr:N-acetylgalactosamine-N,N'-diacetylbacillosaminyl-diphospho-undecaprenol 4-alpha-N-acetylgalactosaminyltransferase [Streptococcus infantarius subsp. infantarius]MCO4504003.1 N-acetylgalactosamine-N,N'-diacetylbacillosaminyl-diphospho-undecaprenol 4-alpha-N-acetylgalactosaminyltransferase [Streptococcus infantarius subsp. infantarius]MCO4527281.1 N-acetylgalactosamine-N,N'-diacetylbacillosaminyl-diphospho-undecaprenol 4-alpha-N-acetylgalactosaminyltransferase [Streptococcus infantarius subsp. i